MPVLSLVLLSAVGFVLSAYAYYVEIRLQAKKLQQKNKRNIYKASCDINDRISCSRAFESAYGHIFGISNSLLGLGYYLFVGLLSYFGMAHYVFYLSIASVIGSLYLAYCSYIKLRTFCVVCTLIYAVNFLMLVFSYFSYLLIK